MSVPGPWRGLFDGAAEKRFPTGAPLLRQGDPATHALLLTAGRVKAVLTLPDGDTVLLAVRGPGELLGEISLLGGDGRSATVVAIDPCRTLVLPAGRFRERVASAGLEGELLRRAMRRIREGEEWRAEIATLHSGPRVVRALLRLAQADARGTVEVGVGQEEIGQAVGLSRGVVAGELKALRAAGLVETGRRRIVLRDLPRLRALAGPGQRDV
ncbi:Crp/Fnr family transcriptional regulator [Actinomadura parmotrematis]|uniref:Crp/Fnr family transcriptional regulator n=1 Tax=Actinomadura parmotrematis TaxID=2864039 RepID=A0ABS7G041_9ACTN|nr:Crp/Fnr family transcriptional regulator [Actinomadura parmotrematis]MBW8486074.1 Crp/Fnr family transcriptional regulator [Actinomadura parmotrematis]